MKAILSMIIFALILSLSFGAFAKAKKKVTGGGGACVEKMAPYKFPKDLKPFKTSISCSRFLIEKGLNKMEEWMNDDPQVQSAVGNIAAEAISKKISEKEMEKFTEDQGMLVALKYLRSIIDYCLCLDNK